MRIFSHSTSHMYVGAYTETTIYRAIMSLHKWFVFCFTKSYDANTLTPEIVKDYCCWLLELRSNSNRHFADPTRFNKQMQKDRIGAQLPRILLIYRRWVSSIPASVLVHL